MKKFLFALLAVAVIFAIWWFLPKETPPVTAPTGTGGVTEEKIIQELDVVDTGDLDAEFRGIDKELNQL